MRFLPTLAPHTIISEDGLVMIRTDSATGERVLVDTATDEVVGREPTDLRARQAARVYAARAREAASLYGLGL